MTDTDYEPSPRDWVRNQVATFEASGGREANMLRDTGRPIIVLTMVGNKSGKVRKVPLMRVEHDGEYVAVASQGGSPTHPVWYYNLVASPTIELQDGAHKWTMDVREITGDEKAVWWERAVAAYPPYADYQQKTDRQIPVFLLTPAASST